MDNLFTPSSIPSFDYDKDLGQSGLPPYTRGIYPNMYQGREFTMRQLTGFGSPEDTNKRIKFMLGNGATGLSILFDFPTIEMYDSDDPLSKGHVGTSGVCIDSIEDMDILFRDIPLDGISISLVTHYPSNTAILFSMYLALASERNIPWNQLRGSVQNDMIMEEVVHCGLDFISPKDCFRIQCDNIGFITDNLPNWHSITFNGYNLREAGTSIITESAVAITNGLDTLSEMIKRGYSVDQISSRMSFFWDIGNNFFEEVARLRALRRLWYRLMKNTFNVQSSKASLMRCHVQTSGISLTRQEPLNNIVRSSYQALAAILGGTQSLHVDSYDEAFSVPSEEAALISLRTQQIIQTETGVTEIVDPLGGSYYIEYLTGELENKILSEVNCIMDNGGCVSLIESKTLYKEIDTYTYEHQRDIENGVVNIVGLNKYKSDNVPSIKPFNYSEEVEQNQVKKLSKLRQERPHRLVGETLQSLSKACQSKHSNVLFSCINCAKARCTEGEMSNAIKSSFGLWNRT